MSHIHMLCCASTGSVRTVAFPGDEPLDLRGRESLARRVGWLPSCDIVVRSPALCAEQTAEGLTLDAAPEPLLRDCDFSRWTGQSLNQVQSQAPDELSDWLRDPRIAPHGGESFADVVTRVGGWMAGLLVASNSVLAITHPAVIRAAIASALGAGPDSLRHIGVAPLTRASLSSDRRRWTLTGLVPLKDPRWRAV